MIGTVTSHHCMQFQVKCMIQTQQKDKKKTHFGSNLGPLGPNSSRQFVFSKIWLCSSLNIMISYHHVQYQKNLMIQSWVNLVTDGRTGSNMDESDFTGRRSSDVERPKDAFILEVNKNRERCKNSNGSVKCKTWSVNYIWCK